jgi:hypothetical protein
VRERSASPRGGSPRPVRCAACSGSRGGQASRCGGPCAARTSRRLRRRAASSGGSRAARPSSPAPTNYARECGKPTSPTRRRQPTAEIRARGATLLPKAHRHAVASSRAMNSCSIIPCS